MKNKTNILNAIEGNLHFLCKHTRNIEVLLINLLSFFVITEDESEEIESQGIDYDQSFKLYTILLDKFQLYCHTHTYEAFINALIKSDNEHIVNKIKSAQTVNVNNDEQDGQQRLEMIERQENESQLV